MFFRRMFQRKNSDDNFGNKSVCDNSNDDSAASDETRYCLSSTQQRLKSQNAKTQPQKREVPQLHRSGAVTSTPRAQRKYAHELAKHCSSATTLHRSSSSAACGLQLTPLWEHILRTRTLPDHICPLKMFAEFLERLRDPEWQVRQHALRVFVDVLVVMGAKADAFMDPVVGQLVENLGHPAPTVRKGALDCLRVYLAESAMPETVLLQILDLGLNQKITNEPFGGRLTCGVLLSLPALVQSTLHTPKRHFILRTTIELLVQKMAQITHQEITLKVLAKIRELIGEPEFRETLPLSALREFELLCNVYGIHQKADGATAWLTACHGQHPKRGSYLENGWGISEEEEQIFKQCSGDKIILETEIKINDDTLTMRILEAKDEETETEDGAESCTDREHDPSRPIQSTVTSLVDLSHPESLEDEVVCGRLSSARNSTDSGGLLQLLSDSDAEEIHRHRDNTTMYVHLLTPSTPTRTPKRVTFGGEIVKMRTPDSDANSSCNQVVVSNKNKKTEHLKTVGETESVKNGTTVNPKTSVAQSNPTSPLCLEIPNDNTKPLARSCVTQTPTALRSINENEVVQTSSKPSPNVTPSLHASPNAAVRHSKDSNTSNLSPRSPFKRLNINSVDSIISPKVPHKEIEVLHNLQREPSPVRARRASLRSSDDADEKEMLNKEVVFQYDVDREASKAFPAGPPARSWEDLGIVNDEVLMDLRSGDWRFRSQGIRALEETLRSSDNLARVQPCLDSLLRVLLSAERHAEVAADKRRLLINLISRLPLDNLEDRTVQIMTGLCRQGGAGASRVCKALMQHLPPAVIVLKLISAEFLQANSSRFREHALQLVAYALMTFPSTCFDTATCITNATFAALDRKKRVRQAALDVLAVLGQVTSARGVLEVAQSVAVARDDGCALMAAVKARLARKQLPLIASDSEARQDNAANSAEQAAPQCDVPAAMPRWVGADVDWVNGGVGSVSPTSLRRRAEKARRSLPARQSFYRLSGRGSGSVPPLCSCGGGGGGSNYCEESCKGRNRPLGTEFSHQSSTEQPVDDPKQSHNVQYILGSSAPLHFGMASKKCHADFSNYMSRRLVAKSCSDSSMDGRSSDSTYTSSSRGGGGGVGGVCNGNSVPDGFAAGTVVAPVVGVTENCGTAAAGGGGAGGISGRFTARQTVHSRFPAMDLNATYVRVHKPTACYSGMGAYAQLQQQQYNINATQTKVNYAMPMNCRRRQVNNARQQLQQQQQQQHQQQQQQQQLQQQRTYCLNSQENFIKQREHFCNERSNNNNNNNNNINKIHKVDNHYNHKNNNNNNNNNIFNKDPDTTYTISGNSKCGGDVISTNNNNNNNNNHYYHYHHSDPQQTTKIVNASVSDGNATTASGNSRRFTNIEKFTTKSSNKYSQTNGSTKEEEDTKNKTTTKMPETHAAVTPTASAGSINYSLKSTASMQSVKSLASASASEGELLKQDNQAASTSTAEQKNAIPNGINVEAIDTEENKCSTPATTLVGTLHSGTTDNEVGSESPVARWSQKVEEEDENEEREQKQRAEHQQDLQVEDVIDLNAEPSLVCIEDAHKETTATQQSNRSRSVSPISLLSRTESIKTQMEGSPSVLSRCQSQKSIVIEEEIELSMNSMAKGSEGDEDDAKSRAKLEAATCSSAIRRTNSIPLDCAGDVTEPETLVRELTPSRSPQHDLDLNSRPVAEAIALRSRSPTIAELKSLSRRNSVMKSLESLYERPASAVSAKCRDVLDTTTESTSSTSSNSTLTQLKQRAEGYINSVVPQQHPHTPLKQKAKTTHFLKTISNRRSISPVRKRVVTVTQAELFPQTMTRFERPREALLKSFDQLDSSNWEINVLGLKALVRLMRYHAETLDNNMHMVCIQLTKAVRNLRSQVARAACQAATEIFSIKSKILEQECDDLVCGLLHRTADTNRFLRADAARALESMCDQLTAGKILNVLTARGATHQHALVRTTTAKLLNRLVERLGCERVYSLPREQRDKFFVTGANLLLEGSLETRGYAKSLFRLLAQHASYNRLLVEVIPTRTYRNVEKALRSIR